MMEKSHLRMIIAGGGTGGHLFPGLAVAEEIKRRHPGSDILFVTGRKSIEMTILERYGFEQAAISIEGVKGRGWFKGITVMSRLPYTLYQSYRIIRAWSPLLVLGVGGYSSGPVCLAARIMRIPTVIHEQNTYPGLTNRLLSRIVNRVFISFEESREHFSRGTLVLTGNPIRQELLDYKVVDQEPDKPFTLFVTGGSQGAAAVNQAFIKAVAILKDKGKDLGIIHQTGEMDYQHVKEEYTRMGIQADVHAFVRDMAAAYGRADLLVGRAGAATVSELAALGKPSVLIPFPYSANQHQVTNARVLAEVGGAILLLQKDLSGESLAKVLIKYMEDRTALREMGERTRKKGRPHAARVIADQLEEMMNI